LSGIIRRTLPTGLPAPRLSAKLLRNRAYSASWSSSGLPGMA
jgi:hypothetical protein